MGRLLAAKNSSKTATPLRPKSTPQIAADPAREAARTA